MQVQTSRRPLLAGLGAVALLVVVFAIVIARGSDDSPSAGAARASGNLAVDVPDAGMAFEDFVDPAPESEAVDLDPDVQIASAREALETYRRFSVYPPFSRPADGSQAHIVDWNQTIPVHLAVPGPEGELPLHAEVRLDRMFVRPGDPLRVVLRAWRERSDGESAPATVDATAVVEVYDEASAEASPENPEAGWKQVLGFGLSPDPARGPGQFAAQFVPSETPGLEDAGRDARVVVRVATATGITPFRLAFRHARVLPVEVHGIRGDRIRDGSLEISLDVETRRAGPVLFQATLFDSEGREAIAVYDGYVPNLREGRQVVDLRFFGRALRERGIDGPYRLGALHGIARAQDEREADLFWGDAGDRTLATRRYRSVDFSNAEWDAPEKREKLQQYEAFIAGIAAGSR